MTERYLLDQFTQAKEAGLEALRRGENGEARCRFLEAARYLYRLAACSEQEQRRAERLRQAEEVRSLAGKVAREMRAEKKEGPFVPVARPRVTLSDVAGLTEAKAELEVRLLLPVRYPEKAQRFGIEPGGGILLYGPPGTGKTLLARAVAGEIDVPFFTVKPSEIMSKWVGESERNIARLFQEARSYELSVVFVDEIEALLPARTVSESTVMGRVVPQILNELDGFGRKGGEILFLAATNVPWNVDGAALRPGRFDRLIYVGLPEAEARAEILRLQLAGRPVAGQVDLEAFSEELEGLSGADIRELVQRAAQQAFLRSIEAQAEEVITWEDLRGALASCHRSVSEKQLTRYEEWRRSRAGAR